MGLYDDLLVNVYLKPIGVVLTKFQTKDLERLMIQYKKNDIIPLESGVVRGLEVIGGNSFEVFFEVANSRIKGVEKVVVRTPFTWFEEGNYMVLENETGEVVWNVGHVTMEEFLQFSLFFDRNELKMNYDEIEIRTEKGSFAMVKGVPRDRGCRNGGYFRRSDSQINNIFVQLLGENYCLDDYVIIEKGNYLYFPKRGSFFLKVLNPKLVSFAFFAATKIEYSTYILLSTGTPVVKYSLEVPVDFVLESYEVSGK